MSYNPTSPKDILAHARLLLGKSLFELYHELLATSQGKGILGTWVETLHFQYRPNSKTEPDFPEAGVELKCTALRQNKDGSLVSKERLVPNIIDYCTEASKTFETSSFWRKNKLLLLMFYLPDAAQNFWEYLFKIVRYWQFPKEDLKIIKEDWHCIQRKLSRGRHILSLKAIPYI